jgi:hypothetical protein
MMEEILNVARLDSDPAISVKSPTRANRRIGITAFVVLTGLLCSGSTAPTTCTSPPPKPIGPSTGEIVGAAVGIGATVAVVTLVAVNHSHHVLKGCVFNGPNGLRLQTSDSKIYTLEGDAASVQAGDRVKLHGSRLKKTKDSSGDQVFKVERLTKNYGPCQVNLAQAGVAAR